MIFFKCWIFNVFFQGFGAGAGSREQKPGGSKTLRHPLEILLLKLMKAYIF